MYYASQQSPRDLDGNYENLYRYGDNNPLNVTDPSGLAWLRPSSLFSRTPGSPGFAWLCRSSR